MNDVGFYHLTRSTAEEALPLLLGRTLSAGRRAVVRCGDAQRVDVLDAALWRSPEPFWLPHGSARSGDADLQPIWITAGIDVPNNATFLFLLDGTEASDADRFERVFDLFDGNDQGQLAQARTRWTTARSRAASLAYWRQDPKGWTRAG